VNKEYKASNGNANILYVPSSE